MEPKGRDESIEIVIALKNDNEQLQQYHQGYLEKSQGGV